MLSGPLYMGIGVRGDERVLNVNEAHLTSWELYLPLSPSRGVARRVGFVGLAKGGDWIWFRVVGGCCGALQPWEGYLRLAPVLV